MVNIWTIAKREYKLYYSSPVAYMIAFVILLVLGIFFYLNIQVATFQQGYIPSIQNTLIPLATMLVLVTPAITTRLLAEEQRLGTIELLLTAPIKDWELVVGKWLGGFLFLMTIVALTLIYPIVLNALVEPGIDQGPMVSGYLGVALVCASLVALGVFVSSLFSNQIAAFATTMGVMVFFWWIIGPIVQVSGPFGGGSELLSYLDFNEHFFGSMVNGIIDLRDLMYYLSFTAFWLFFGAISVEIRRWR